ncbi:MAG: hypothetical protein ACE5EF_08090 [Dehalococcoidia bacterium]
MTRIAVTGLPFFGPRAASGLRQAGFEATYVPRPGARPATWPRFLLELARADAFYSIGSSASRGSPNDRIAALRRKVIMHWVGSDVLSASEARRRNELSNRLVRDAVHWADAPWLVEELRGIGIAAAEHPLPIPIAIGSPEPPPANFRVLVYLPAGRHPAHDIEGTLAVVRALPEVSFLAIGGREAVAPLPNLEHRGYVQTVAPIYRECAAILRLTHHDGLSHSIVEALSFGRHAVWTRHLPGVRQVEDAEGAIEAIRELAAQSAVGSLGVNTRGAAFVTERYAEPNIAEELTEAMHQALGTAETRNQ